MFSKFKRSKADAKNETPKLRGMPALKQERSSKRNGLASPTSLPVARQQELTEFGRTGIASSQPEMKFIGTKPDILQNTDDRSSFDGMTNKEVDKTRRQLKSERKNIENRSRYTSKLDKKCQDNELTDPVENETEHEDENGYGKNKDEKKSTPKMKKVDNDKGKGRRLHSVKKQRKASRDCDVTTSMRALTPRERESILFLEETLKEIDQSSLKGSHHENDTGDNLSDSDSFGSIIDLVGNLPASRSQHPVENRSVCNQKPQVTCTQESSVNNMVRSKYIANRVYAEIADVKETVGEERLNDDDIYQEIMVNNNNNNNNNSETSTRGKGIKETDSLMDDSNDSASIMQSKNAKESIDTQPVYSVVRKTRKATPKGSSRNNTQENGIKNTKSISSVRVLPTSASTKNEIAYSGNSHNIWNDPSKRTPNRVKSMYNPIPSHQVLPSLAETSIDTCRLSSLPDIDESLRAKPGQFVVVPTKGKKPPAIIPRKPSTKLRRHQSERSHAEHAKLKTVNGVAQDRLNFDQRGNLISPASASMAGLDINGDDKMIAIPRQTTLYEQSGIRRKPFIITPANRGVISWK